MDDYQHFIKGCKNICYLKYNVHYYIIDFYNCLQMEITENLYECIRSIKNGIDYDIINARYSRELPFLISAMKKGVLSVETPIAESSAEYASLSFTPIHKCNFSCRYCFAKAGSTYSDIEKDFTNEKIEKMLDFFFVKLFPDMKRYRIEFVSGGEPLLNTALIQKTVEYSERFQLRSNKSVQIWLCTNGSLLTKDFVRFLDMHNVSIGISIDGDKKSHNANRIYPNGQGTYDDVICGLKTVLENNQIGNKMKHIWGLSVINENNCDLIAIIKHYKHIGIKSAQMKIEWKENSNEKEAFRLYKLYAFEYEKLAMFLLRQYNSNNVDYLLMIINDNDQFGKILKKYITGTYASRRCEAGRYKVAVCPNGDIYPCYGFIGIKDMKIGSVFENCINWELFKDANVKTNSKCTNCDIMHLCGGECYYSSYINTGNINYPSECYCYIQKKLCELGIWLLIEMRKANIILYEQLAKEIIHCDNIRRQ